LNPNNVEWFADAIETGAIKIPEIQKQYAKIKEELESIDYKKTMAKYELDNMHKLFFPFVTFRYGKSFESLLRQW
jgi:hypothetical protein